ncbi:SLC13 family permease [Aliifodinibius sp. S!AR15-10]|uniref:SLC13 family permease n=1 Tax=Aliifodinibius sp. S!AR15-10 TaxID=2950437 RepID=UPI00285D88E8|nr:SLC13 family permease [Aliifodinibius sp. S!AR15-10]MDR8393512.1 SLC13 family permease [Aliifodinibius sp. S!AR15-10]
MTLAGWSVIFVVVLCLVLLISTRISPEIIFLGGLTLLIIGNAVTAEEALVGFSNQGMLTVAALYVVAAGLKETGAIHLIVNKIIGHSKSIRRAQLRIMAPVMVVSAFLNNTPVVASFIPAMEDWSRKNRIPASKILIPLSYAAILGGTCTLIGTSTNLIVNGLLIKESSTSALGIFEPGLIGVPCAIAGFLYLAIFAKRMLPIRGSGFDTFKDPREYTIEMIVDEGSQLSGKTIEEAGLRHLPSLYLVEIYRNGQILAAVEPEERLYEKDRLIFTGIVNSIVDLQQVKGISPATDQVFKLDAPRRERLLIEAVVSQSHPLNGQTIKEGGFRNRYDAVVLAVSRNGERVKEKVGDIRLKTGDTLLLEAHPIFVDRYKNSTDYFLVSGIADSSPPNYEHSVYAWSILGGMVVSVALGVLSMFQASFLAAGLMILTGCCKTTVAKDSIDWTVLLVIAATLGLGNALQVTGAAEVLASGLLKYADANPHLALAATYLATWILTELVTNNAAAVLIFPIAISMAASFGVSYMPFVMVIIMAASASFSTPIGYQTNLMVYGPGGYKFTDFTKIGLPLNLIVATITIILVPIIWPL